MGLFRDHLTSHMGTIPLPFKIILHSIDPAMRLFTCIIFLMTVLWSAAVSADLPSVDLPDSLDRLFKERVGCLVSVKFFVQREIDRKPYESAGLVVDSDGLVVLLDNAVPSWLPHGWFKDFQIFLPGEGEKGCDAEYLGRDYLTGWHYLRVDRDNLERLVPITRFETKEPRIGQLLWGIGLLGNTFDYAPYFLSGRLSSVQNLPLRIGFSNSELSTPGGPIFDFEGNFVGWAGNPLTEERILYMRRDQYTVGLRNISESAAFLFAEDFFADLGRVPVDPAGDPRPWIGVAGLKSVDREVASYLGLEGQGAVVLSQVLDDSPAAAGGLQDKDIIVAIDGKPLPKFRPNDVAQTYFERQLLLAKIGESMSLTVIRDDETRDITVEIKEHPTAINQAKRQYFTELGLTAREFLLRDAVGRRLSLSKSSGIIASFVKPNSPVNTAGLQQGDWIKEIDGTIVEDYENAVFLLRDIEADGERTEFVLLIDRNNETSVLRVKVRKPAN